MERTWRQNTIILIYLTLVSILGFSSPRKTNVTYAKVIKMQLKTDGKSWKRSMRRIFKIRIKRGNWKKRIRNWQKTKRIRAWFSLTFRKFCQHQKQKLVIFITNENYPFTILLFMMLFATELCATYGATMTLKRDRMRIPVVYCIIWKKIREGITNFILWSDNCGGQNRNKIVLSMFLHVSAKYNVNIRQSFLEVGHTQNGMPREQRESKQTKPKYEVVIVTFDMIFDFKDLSTKLNWNQSVINKKKKKKISRAHRNFQIEASNSIKRAT